MGALDFFCFGSTLSVQSSSPEREKKLFSRTNFPLSSFKIFPPLRRLRQEQWGLLEKGCVTRRP